MELQEVGACDGFSQPARLFQAQLGKSPSFAELRVFPHSELRQGPGLSKRQSWRTVYQPKEIMKIELKRTVEEGKVGWIFLWLLGIPIPILLILFLLRGCT